ncbi:hypothetical protein GWK47_034331 [Chionoecetes opilio]|uniref:Uncharacterized protein n=1 Tax=Chionoecetes opilio TaxID=41210 RepID=A0A8J4YUW3_CHIOP|nr:hypothetical protein GWK47_034331 [Chionoecetes opilio]
MKENSSTFGIIVNVGNLSSTRTRLNVLGRIPTDSPVCAPRGPGDLKVLWDLFGQSGQRLFQRNKCALFSNCDFCPKNDSGHCTVFLLTQWVNTPTDQAENPRDHVRVSVRPLEEPGDASALEKKLSGHVCALHSEYQRGQITVMCHSFAQFLMHNWSSLFKHLE